MHHREIAALDPAEADALLDAADENGWSAQQHAPKSRNAAARAPIINR
jgi:hypothetical protein